MINMGISSVLWGCSALWGYHEYYGGYLVPWGNIMMHAADIMSNVGVFSTVGNTIFYLSTPATLNVPHGAHGIPHVHGTQDIPHIYHDILRGY